MLVGVVLAGGLSTRMGVDKATLCHPISGLSLVSHAQASLMQAGADVTIISSNQLPGMVADKYPHLGPLSGIHGAFSYCKKNHPSTLGVLFLPVDMPMITPTLLTTLYEQGRLRGKPCFYGRQFLPLYLPFSLAVLDYLQDTLEKGENTSLKGMLSGNLAPVQLDIPIVSEDAGVFTNLNQPNQWAAFQKTQLKPTT
ncbi:MAG: molybdopterin-guanine dinucleotide biosynthesis protein A [Paraglaciecola sp.]